MNWERIDAEREALQGLMDLYENAKKCQQLYERADLALPEALQRFLGVGETVAKAATTRPKQSTVRIPLPEKRNQPEGAEQDWISITSNNASATAIALAILRKTGTAMRSRDLFQKLTEILPDVPSGTLANIGTRLQGTIIDRTDEGWRLLKLEAAGILHEGYFWGPLSIFGKQELAAQRREAILHILRHFPTGLQTVQLVEQLMNCAWVKAPVNKDLLKADMEMLDREGKVRRRGNSKKWEILE